MRMYDIIAKKRDGGALSREEIAFFINGYVDGSIPDYQAAALCMAIYFQGMTDEETVILTDCMARSGDMVDLSDFGDLSVDKHSTGGVGDKTSLIITPIVASLGGKVTKMSGRGLGHTGGTVDKLESIPGYQVTMPREDFIRQVHDVGIAVIGQSGNLTPADKKLYALRDVTATVNSIPLITSSIMSKKIAAGSKNIVLDVKTGSGAFMKTVGDARILAENMVRIGKSCGRNIAALITEMDRPLGSAVGNALEVIEAIDVLKNGKKGDLYEVCVALASEMVALFRKIGHDEAEALVIEAIDSGAAFEKMKEWIAAQGGDVRYIEDPDLFPQAACAVPVLAPKSGYLTAMDAEAIGTAAVILGAGRSAKDDVIDYAAGIMIDKKTGDRVEKGDTLAVLYTNQEASVASARERYLSALTIADTEPDKTKLIYDIIR
jgi:pyrimidine-nucleoside phosphorylase